MYAGLGSDLGRASGLQAVRPVLFPSGPRRVPFGVLPVWTTPIWSSLSQPIWCVGTERTRPPYFRAIRRRLPLAWRMLFSRAMDRHCGGRRYDPPRLRGGLFRAKALASRKPQFSANLKDRGSLRSVEDLECPMSRLPIEGTIERPLALAERCRRLAASITNRQTSQGILEVAESCEAMVAELRGATHR